MVTTENEKPQEKWSRTIALELLEAWQGLKRKKDPEALAKYCKVSRPVIDRALIYGYVSIPSLTEKINNFFKERLMTERESAVKLNNLSDEVKNLAKNDRK